MEEVERPIEERQVVAVPRLISAAEAGEILGISAKTVHKLVRSGRLGCVEITTRKRRFTMELVEEFIEAETYHRHEMWN